MLLPSQELLFACAQSIRVDFLQSLDQQKVSFQISSLQIDNQLRSSPYTVLLSFDREYKSSQAERKLQRTSDGFYEPVFSIAVSKWRKKDLSLVSFEYIILRCQLLQFFLLLFFSLLSIASLVLPLVTSNAYDFSNAYRVADFHLELGQEVILSLFDFIKNVTSRFQSTVVHLSDPLSLVSDASLVESSSHAQISEYQKAGDINHFIHIHAFNDYKKHNESLPLVVPIGAPWQQIYLLARRQRKIYVEVFEISPINLTLRLTTNPEEKMSFLC